MNALKILKNMGVRWTFNRTIYEIKKRSGILKKKFLMEELSDQDFTERYTSNTPNSKDSTYVFYKSIIKNSNNFFFDPKYIRNEIHLMMTSIPDKFTINEKVNRADKILDNEFKYFSNELVYLPKVVWNFNPKTKKTALKDEHWLDISDLHSNFGDIKYIWELSRFSFVYDLVKAYAITNDDIYIKKYWQLVDDWIYENPLELGINYKCGQEMTIRVMAWINGLYAFKDSEESTPSRVTRLIKHIYYHTDHIEKHFEFALKSVRNNHTISEAAGMYTVGLLFPFLDKSTKWMEKGKKYLEKEAQWQIYEDGSYIQNSMNYHRLVLQMYTWVLRLGEINKDEFSDELKTLLKKSTYFLYQHQLKDNGRVPNYGANDGALVHQFSSCDYLDYRPQLNAMWYQLTGNRLYENGSYDDNMLWLYGKDYTKSSIERVTQKSSEFLEGGYYTIRAEKDFGSIRCTSYKNRPAQSDMLHFNLWIDNVNLFTDAGSFMYNTENKVLNYFRGSSSHNGLIINGKDQMQKGSRFMWYNWTKSKKIKFLSNQSFNVFEGEHYGYSPLTHRRALLNLNKTWIVIDDVFGDFNNKEHKIELSWLLGINAINAIKTNEWGFEINNEPYKLNVLVPDNTAIERYFGSHDPFRGWKSLYYGEKIKAPQLSFTSHSAKNQRFITIVSQRDIGISYNNNSLHIGDNTIKLDEIGNSNIIKKINEEVT